jgi:ribose transport system permease protein
VTEKPQITSETGVPSGGVTGYLRSGRFKNALQVVIMQAGPLIALILLAAYLSFATPFFLRSSNLVNITRQSAITAIIAVGQTFVILTGGIDLSVGAVAAISASAAAVLMTQQIQVGGMSIGPVNFWAGMPIALIIGVLAGMLNGLIITRGRIPDFIATLGTLATLRGIALLITGGLPVPSHLTATELRGYLPGEMIWMGSADLLGIPVAGLIALGAGLIGWYILRYTAFGRSIYAVGGNREAARVSGINIDRTKLLVYAFSGLMAAIAGMVLAGRVNYSKALIGEEEKFRCVFGSLIGALIIGVLANGLNLLNVSAFWQRVVQGVVIILVVMFDMWRRRRFSR